MAWCVPVSPVPAVRYNKKSPGTTGAFFIFAAIRAKFKLLAFLLS